MNKAFLVFLLALSMQLFAQQEVSVYTRDGSKIVGEEISRDSVSGYLKVKIQGGSELAVKFSDISVIKYHEMQEFYNHPYFGFGLGSAMNADKKLFQFDIMLGYQFTKRFQAGIGFCASEVIAGYTDLRYFPYSKKFFALGVYTQPGMILTRVTNNDYYYSNGKTNGFYSNSGFTVKLFDDKKNSVSLNLGYEYINKRETYTDYTGQKTSYINKLNRYVIQGIFAF